jgi:peptide/nickel transport system substrate-binding protein
MNDMKEKLDAAKKLASRGKVSRRDFVQLAIAAGLSIPAANAMFVAAARAEPKKGGHFRIGTAHGTTSDSLDPATYIDPMMGTVGWGFSSNGLTEIDAAGTIIPDLAESFEPSDGNKVWAYTLRKGVQFHNGKDVTADDVVASFQHHMGPDSSSAAKSVLASIEDVKADGNKVVFRLKGSNGDFPYLTSDYHLPIVPAKDGKADWQSSVRTGPYKIEKVEPGVRAHLTRNPSYYRDAWFDEVSVFTIADVAARTNALLAGEIDYMDRCDLKTLPALQASPDLDIAQTTGYGHYILAMITTMAPFNDPNVRNAIKFAIDREEISQKVFAGINLPGNDNPIAPSVKFAVNPEPVHKYDPERAKSLLKKAGLERLSIDLSVADIAFAGAIDVGTLFKEQAKAAGIDINVIREADDAYWDVVSMKKPFCASFTNGRPTADWQFTLYYAAGAAWNETFWSNDRFNELLAAARSETDDVKRAAMYAEMQQLVHDDGGLINLVWSTYVSANSKTLAHGKVAANWDLDGQKIASRWWFV